MQVLRFATRSHIESIFEENHPLWGKPLSPEQYRDYWHALFLTPWGSSNLRYMALTEEEEGPLLSTLKLYRFTGRLNGRAVVIAGIGAVYTPAAERTRGSASLLISEVLDYMQKKGAGLALLHTEIGIPFYERLGFVPLRATETSGRLGGAARDCGPPPRGLEVRDVSIQDAKLLVPYHREITGTLPLAIERDAPYWEFILFRRRRFWELAPPRAGRPLSAIAVENGRVLGAGFATVREGLLVIHELGALEGRDEALRAIVDHLWEEGISAGARSWRGRLAAGLSDREPRLRGEIRQADTDIPMAAPLGSTPDLADPASDPSFSLPGLDAI